MDWKILIAVLYILTSRILVTEWEYCMFPSIKTKMQSNIFFMLDCILVLAPSAKIFPLLQEFLYFSLFTYIDIDLVILDSLSNNWTEYSGLV